ncbi:response regulator [Burkholderia pseudomallei TSV28]|nr:response regulator [Burkholderia pseudomallei TSV28]
MFRLPRIRSSFEGIVVIVTSYRNDADECLALSSGADDYIYWDENELVLIERVRLYSRRLLRGRGGG